MSSYELSNTLVKHYAGSLAYGTNLPTSDVDIRGIFCASPQEIRTPYFPVREVSLPDEEDGKLYELSNFMKLYTDCNPNIVETLWVDNSDIITSSPMYDYLREYRSGLLSSKVAHTFSGYAISQLKRIKGHNKWINNPQPVEAPKHEDFVKLVRNFTEAKIMGSHFNMDYLRGHSMVHYGGDIFGVFSGEGNTAITTQGDFNISCRQTSSGVEDHLPKYIVKYCAEEFKRAKEKHSQYWTWKNNRNEKRSALEESFGYDTKHAMHLIRLLRMGEEILTGQGVIVKRPDAQELLAIRSGEWEYEDLIKWADEKDKHIRGELYRNTSLRKKPDVKLAAKVLMECQDMCW